MKGAWRDLDERLTGTPARVLVLCLAIALLVSAVFFALSSRRIESDAWLYYLLAVNVSEGRGYSIAENGAHLGGTIVPFMGREPLYSLLLAAMFVVTGPSLVAVFLLQVVLLGLTGLLVFLIGREITGSHRFGVIVGAATSAFPTLANYTALVLREMFFTFLVAAALYLTLRALRTARGWVFCGAGVAWGLAVLCRAVVLPLPILLVGYAVVFVARGGRGRLRALRQGAVMLVTIAVVLSPWSVRNFIVFGQPGLTPRSSAHFLLRARRVLLSDAEMKMYALYAVSETLANKVYPGLNLRSVGDGYFYQANAAHVAELRARFVTEAELADAMSREASELVRTHPGRYALTGLIELVKFNNYSHVPLLAERAMEARFGGTAVLPALRGVFKTLGFLWLFVVVAGCAVLWRRGWGLVVFVIGYFNLVHTIVDSIGRYAVPIIPYYLLVGSAMVWWVRARVAARHTAPHLAERMPL